MENLNFNQEKLAVLNSNIGLKYLFSDKNFDYDKAIKLSQYEKDLKALQVELVQLQNWVIKNKKKVVIIFEGRDAAGKGGAIRRITGSINPRHYRTIALSKPTIDEQGQWYFQRYVNQLPKPGEMVFFDRSWYNRAIVEPVNGFCTTEAYQTFIRQVNDFEKMILESDTYLIKFYFSITKKEQARRFKEIKKDPLKKWKMTPVDKKAQKLWNEYTKYKNLMFATTDTKESPWIIIDANEKTTARIAAAEYILKSIPYKSKK
ncbi:MAG: polyphosphate kinase 2 [Saprospiraceae bacterium]